jgi:hypothetical protein
LTRSGFFPQACGLTALIEAANFAYPAKAALIRNHDATFAGVLQNHYPSKLRSRVRVVDKSLTIRLPLHHGT